MSNTELMNITSMRAISAIYFALLQSGYDYYGMGRSKEHVSAIEQFVGLKDVPPFFAGAKQNTCEVYPYWPRAAILETALFYLQPDQQVFLNYAGFQRDIFESDNIADHERSEALWKWIEGFPAALSSVMACDAFENYFSWEQEWLAEQNAKCATELQQIKNCLDLCVAKYADYHLFEHSFVYCSGAFHAESVIHEFLHHVVHPAIADVADDVLAVEHIYADLDPSYYLSGNDAGKLNAFEEHAVRLLTQDILADVYPDDLLEYLRRIAITDVGV